MEINYFLAIGYALIGWIVQVTVYYFKFDTDAPFDKGKFWNTYDKYIILGFVGSIALALAGDFGWPTIMETFGIKNIAYDERANIFIGFASVLLIMWFSRNAHKKLDQ